MKFKHDYLKGILMASRLLKNAEGGEGGGGTNPPSPPAPQPAPAPTPTPTPAPTPEPTPAPEPDAKFDAKQKRAVDAMIASAVEAAITKTKDEIAAAAKLEEDKAKGEFEKLYTELKPQYDELKLKVDALEEVVKAEVETRMKSLPEGMEKLMPKGTPIEQLEWLQTASEFKGVLGEPPPTPPNADGDVTGAMLKEAMDARRQSGLYS